ncbi:hypothetical protein MSAN_01259100 [Mycena sanguinolenta]|uniref:Uncharacterized protein n=1 Tax=Mycena sanguinolenta TaxID=230812 RepID=A0A8H6YHP2_9AGAR|nr:hypothetical protein MSAN_01259100 [Mycena sanguinolenta]
MQTASLAAPLVFHNHRPTPATSLFGGASDEYRELEAQLAESFFKLSLHDQWSKCRLQNSRARSGMHVLRPLLTTANKIPILFPLTLGDMRALDLISVLALLQAYEQPVPADMELDAARRALARFVGVLNP